MNRINETFKRLKAEGKKAFIPYIAAGDPDMKTSGKIVRVLAAEGADLIELGIPFSDPLADGPTIQMATQRSLAAGCTVRKVLDMVAELRRGMDVPMVFMTYYNIIFNYGVGRFIRDAKRSGADGIIVPDLPMEESEELTEIADKEDFCVILLAAPTTPPDRFRKLSGRSRGFIYYVSVTGVTGIRKKLSERLENDVIKLRKLTSKPICVGFGISDPSQARDIARVSDGIIVGSAIIKVLAGHLGDKKRMVSSVEKFARSIARAVHGV
ncbi:MAG: tryptophan synthase subunit alpha [Candidatus Omnitrophota bacterium]|nr:tryptophan synthase subunit alpha [Candidatus Omnitrophota bacterium]